jgi:hypothetical protein
MAPEPAVTSGMSIHEALALLPLPERLSDVQREGRVCVFGGEELVTATAVRLGDRERHGRMIFPRACRTCVRNEALDLLSIHCLGPNACPDCQEGPICEIGAALNRVIKLGRR